MESTDSFHIPQIPFLLGYELRATQQLPPASHQTEHGRTWPEQSWEDSSFTGSFAAVDGTGLCGQSRQGGSWGGNLKSLSQNHLIKDILFYYFMSIMQKRVLSPDIKLVHLESCFCLLILKYTVPCVIIMSS